MAFLVPYSAILLTVVYAVFATLIIIFVPECINEQECGTEGVENAVIFWSTDFFVGITGALLALHLYRTTFQGGESTLTFVLFAIGYILKALLPFSLAIVEQMTGEA